MHNASGLPGAASAAAILLQQFVRFGYALVITVQNSVGPGWILEVRSCCDAS